MESKYEEVYLMDIAEEISYVYGGIIWEQLSGTTTYDTHIPSQHLLFAYITVLQL